MPGGAEGFTLKEASAKEEVKVNLAELRKTRRLQEIGAADVA